MSQRIYAKGGLVIYQANIAKHRVAQVGGRTSVEVVLNVKPHNKKGAHGDIFGGLLGDDEHKKVAVKFQKRVDAPDSNTSGSASSSLDCADGSSLEAFGTQRLDVQNPKDQDNAAAVIHEADLMEQIAVEAVEKLGTVHRNIIEVLGYSAL